MGVRAFSDQQKISRALLAKKKVQFVPYWYEENVEFTGEPLEDYDILLDVIREDLQSVEA